MLKRERRKAIAVMLAVTMITGASAVHANFADDWVSQTASTNPGYFQGSQRGYFTGGSFSARWPQSSDHLLTISKPAVKSGCGGIDTFMGGFSFLNTDMLVQKLQRILSAAPAAAFDIALKTLAPQVSDTIKGLENIVDKLNNLQLDDCKAAKALVATSASPFSSVMSDSVAAEMNSAKTDFMVSSGANDLYSGVQNTFKSENASGATPTGQGAANSAMAGCPAVLKDIFGGGSILEKIGATKGIPSTHIASIRGFIGDAYVYPPNLTGNDPITLYNPPCGKSTYQGMIDGTAQIADEAGTCSDSTDTNRNLVTYVSSRLTSIAASIKNKTALDPTDAQFISSLPLPIWPALRAAVQTGTEQMIIGKLGDIAAKGLAYQMMADMMIRIYQVNDYAKHARSSQKASDGAPETCQLAMFEQPFQILQEVILNAQTRAKEAYDGYAAAAANEAAIESLVAALAKFNDLTRKEMASRFSQGVAGRVVGR